MWLDAKCWVCWLMGDNVRLRSYLRSIDGQLNMGHQGGGKPFFTTSHFFLFLHFLAVIRSELNRLELDTALASGQYPGCDQADHSPVSGAEGAAPSSWICSTGALTSVSSTVTTSHLILSLGNIVINVRNRKEGYQEAALSQKKLNLSPKNCLGFL